MFAKRILRRIIPENFRKVFRNFGILSEDYGQRKSISTWKWIDKEGNAIPWYTYPTIEYLVSLDFSGSKILEFGSGASSIWWARRAESVLAVEHNKEWFATSARNIVANLKIILAESKSDYLVAATGGKFDVVIIDGIHRHRCAETVSDILAADGLVILDNSDWHPETAKYLREKHDFLQVDFHGFGPINNYTWTTSLFFSRSFLCRPSSARLPGYSIGALKLLADDQHPVAATARQ
ncbi:MAG: class I SAM-dependent methyltransferase [Candidatus Nitrotoga sp.]